MKARGNPLCRAGHHLPDNGSGRLKLELELNQQPREVGRHVTIWLTDPGFDPGLTPGRLRRTLIATFAGWALCFPTSTIRSFPEPSASAMSIWRREA